MKPVSYDKYTYRELPLNTRQLEVPHNSYQRDFRPRRAKRIAAAFDERIANEPKVSFRDGHYYVFDGQHTIAARRMLNGGKDLVVKCQVFYGMTEAEEAILFSQQTGISARLSPGERVRAEIVGGNQDAIAFLKATEEVGLHLDYAQSRGKNRIACIGTARAEFEKVGADCYKEALRLILKAWDGDSHSLRAEVVRGVIQFVHLYHEEYNPQRLVRHLRRVDPLTIYREGQAMGNTMGAGKKYLFQVYRIYNGNSQKYALPLKF